MRHVDLFVTTSPYDVLKADGWDEKMSSGGRQLTRGVYEATDTWKYGDYNRPKDLADVALIERYLRDPT